MTSVPGGSTPGPEVATPGGTRTEPPGQAIGVVAIVGAAADAEALAPEPPDPDGVVPAVAPVVPAATAEAVDPVVDAAPDAEPITLGVAVPGAVLVVGVAVHRTRAQVSRMKATSAASTQTHGPRRR